LIEKSTKKRKEKKRNTNPIPRSGRGDKSPRKFRANPQMKKKATSTNNEIEPENLYFILQSRRYISYKTLNTQ